jgi:hypothetical protein
MIRLDTTTRSLELVLAGAITTTNPDIVASYSDKTSSAYTGGTKATVGNGVTVVTIVAAPAASTIRDIDHINLRNNDTVSITATIKLNDNATLYKLVTITLLTGESLEYTHAIGWCALDVNGNRKEVTSSVFSSLTVTGTTTVSGQLIGKGTATNDSAAAGYIGECINSIVVVTTTGATSGAYANVTSISLTAGDWDVRGSVSLNGAAATTLVSITGAFSTTSAAFSIGNPFLVSVILGVTESSLTFAPAAAVPTMRLSIASPTTVYLVIYPLFGGGTAGIGGFIEARRVR